MTQWIDKGEIALWPDKKAHGKQPVVRGNVTIDGLEYKLSLWRSTSQNPNAPTYWGKVQLEVDDNAPPPQQQQREPEPPPPEDEFDDDIPF
jgi:hypothetical protein